MPFMEPQVEYGHWYEVDGPCGTEYVPAELVGTVTDEKGAQHFPSLDELQEFDRDNDPDSVRFPIPSALADYCENSEAWAIRLIEGYGARLSAPGYMDCTEWSVFETEEEARDHLTEMYGDEEDSNDDL